MKCVDWIAPIVERDLWLALIWKSSDVGFESPISPAPSTASITEANNLARDRFVFDDGSNLRVIKRQGGEGNIPMQVVFVSNVRIFAIICRTDIPGSKRMTDRKRRFFPTDAL